MPKRTFCFVKPTEMHGIKGHAAWAKPSMREALNLGTGSWFILFVNDQQRAAVEMGSFLVRVGFTYAYDFAKQEKDSRKLAKAALDWRTGKLDVEEFGAIREGIRQKYARNFESYPLIVANRLASDSPCSVAAAACLDCVQADHDAIAGAIIDYAKRVIRL